MSYLTVAEALEARRQLERDIAQLLHNFEKVTKLSTTAVELQRVDYVHLHDRRQVLIGVTVRVEL